MSRVSQIQRAFPVARERGRRSLAAPPEGRRPRPGRAPRPQTACATVRTRTRTKRPRPILDPRRPAEYTAVPDMMIVGIIPARYASVRFPGKPLARLAGNPMVLHVLEAARAARRLDRVARRDGRRADRGGGPGGGRRSDPDLAGRGERDRPAGRGRARPARRRLRQRPGRRAAHVRREHRPRDRDAARRARPRDRDARRCRSTRREAPDPNVVKVAVAGDGRALYFSRSPIPFFRQGTPAYRKHLGLYVYRAATLPRLAALPPSPLERAESLEQLRWLEAGYTIWVGEAATDSIGVDTPEDLARAEQLLKGEAAS